MVTIVKAIPKPIEYNAFFFDGIDINATFPPDFPGRLETRVNRNPNNVVDIPYVVGIRMSVFGTDKVYRGPRWFIKTGNNAWQVKTPSAFAKVYDIKEENKWVGLEEDRKAYEGASNAEQLAYDAYIQTLTDSTKEQPFEWGFRNWLAINKRNFR